MPDNDKYSSPLDEVARFGSRIADAVDKAVHSGDFSKMSEQIHAQQRNGSFSGTGNNGQYRGGHMETSGVYSQRRAASRGRRKALTPEERRSMELAAYFVPDPGKAGGIAMQVIGIIGTCIFGLLTAAFSLGAAGTGFGPLVALAWFFGVLTALCGATTYLGVRRKRAVKRYKKYVSVLSDNLYMDIKEIALRTGINEKRVRRDLANFTEKGWFRQGHFDLKQSCFICTDELFDQYIRAEKMAAEQKKEETVKKKQTKSETAAKTKESEYSEEVRKILDQGNEYIELIRKVNEDVPGEEVTEKLYRMEMIVRKIFDEVRKKPSLAKELSMFMSYYLPTTAKLITAYRDMDAQEVQGENIRAAKRDIENSLATINDAFETQLDQFFKDQALDVASDISVMKTMMKQNGLTPDDLSKVKGQYATQAKQ